MAKEKYVPSAKRKIRVQAQTVAGLIEENDQLRREKERLLKDNDKLREAVENLATKINEFRSELSKLNSIINR